jgi:peptidoglycan hydrolase CwlO-like protein
MTFEEWFAQQHKKKVATHEDIYGTAWAAWHYQQAIIDGLEAEQKDARLSTQVAHLDNIVCDVQNKSEDLEEQIEALTERVEHLERFLNNP